MLKTFPYRSKPFPYRSKPNRDGGRINNIRYILPTRRKITRRGIRNRLKPSKGIYLEVQRDLKGTDRKRKKGYCYKGGRHSADEAGKERAEGFSIEGEGVIPLENSEIPIPQQKWNFLVARLHPLTRHFQFDQI